jgi:hypothetical protein
MGFEVAAAVPVHRWEEWEPNPPQAPDVPGLSFVKRENGYQPGTLCANERGFSICSGDLRIKRSEIMTQHHHKHATLTHAGPGKPTTPTKATVASGDNDHIGKLVSDEAIRLCAYQKWEAAGKPTGDGVRFWLEAEQELAEGKNGEFVGSGWQGYREHEWQEAENAVKESNVNVDSHYRDNNRMFQSHGERGHRHGGSS